MGWCQLYLKRIALWFPPVPYKLLLLIEGSNTLKPDEAGEKRESLGYFVCPYMKEFRVEQGSSQIYEFLTSTSFLVEVRAYI